MRTILHSDLNAFYASVETVYRPELREVPLAVCGDPEARHGIVLTKNQLAKGYGVRTGEPIYMARQRCPGLVVLKPDMKKYYRFAQRMHAIYADFTDRVESFGLDEAWLDVTGENGRLVADEIRRRAREELGLTASVGVADNKIFAKLGSDMQKPDATTIITRDNFRQKVWPLPVGDLLYVGPATQRKLFMRNVLTIGDLARCETGVLHSALGKAGGMLHTFANGLDQSAVSRTDTADVIKSIGNSMTAARDLLDDADARWMLMFLAETVGARLREHGVKGREIQIWIRDCEMFSFERQAKLDAPTDLDHELAAAAHALFRKSYGWLHPVRSLGLRVGALCTADGDRQLSFFDDPGRDRRRALEKSIDRLNQRFGEHCVRRAALLCKTGLVPDGPAPGEEYVSHGFTGRQERVGNIVGFKTH